MKTWRGYHPKRIQELGLEVDRWDFWVRDVVTNEVRLMTDVEWSEAMA